MASRIIRLQDIVEEVHKHHPEWIPASSRRPTSFQPRPTKASCA